jgi:hypothetical protein
MLGWQLHCYHSPPKRATKGTGRTKERKPTDANLASEPRLIKKDASPERRHTARLPTLYFVLRTPYFAFPLISERPTALPPPYRLG